MELDQHTLEAGVKCGSITDCLVDAIIRKKMYYVHGSYADNSVDKVCEVTNNKGGEVGRVEV